MGGQRKALIVANDEYDNDALRRLKAPAADARALAHVLGDRDIGGFRVDVVLNEPAHHIEARIEDLFSDSQPDDILLLHFSCHGLKSEAGELFFAARNTRPDRLGSTAIPADFIQRCMKSCRARSIVLFLDCCYGGAFGQGVTVRASGSANVLDAFPAGKLGGGKGRAVITASSSMEYAFEGNKLADNHQQEPSVFTSALVEGLETGEADRDEDGLVSLNELYEFVFDKVREKNPNQTPSRDVEMQGELYVARSKRKRIRPLPIPAEVQTALQDPNMFTRLGAVSELRARLNSGDVAAALGAHEALQDLTHKDIKYVGDAAAEALAGAVINVIEKELSFGSVEMGAATAALVLHLSGPPVARTCTVSTTDPWIAVAQSTDGHLVTVDTSTAGRMRGSVTVKGLLGEAVVPVAVDVMTAVVEVKPVAAEAHPVAAEAEPVVAQAEPVVAQAEPVVAEVKPVVAQAEPVVAVVKSVAVEPKPVAAAAVKPIPAPPVVVVTPAGSGLADPASAYGHSGGRTRLPAGLALVGGALSVIGVFLPFQWGEPTTHQAPYIVWYLLLVGGLALAGGLCSLVQRTGQWVGPGLVMGSAATSTWGLGYVVVVRQASDSEGFNFGFQLLNLAQPLLIAAGCVAAVRLARLDEVQTRNLTRHDLLGWLIVVLAAVGALLTFLAAVDAWQLDASYGAVTVWAAFLSIVMPISAVLLRPRRLGVAVMGGWLVGGLALTAHYSQLLGDKSDSTKVSQFFLTLVALAVITIFWSRSKGDNAKPPPPRN